MRFGKFFLFALLLVSTANLYGQQRTYQVKEAKQAVAVDKQFFYVINNSTVVKYRKSDGVETGVWDGSKLGIKHLNSGVVIDGKLYCANSNYPEVPMASALEIFDVREMKHIGSHSFGISNHGSLTWVDQKDGYWYAGFAHYGGKESSEGRDPRWTSLVKYTKDWLEVESWIFPKEIIGLFGTKSNSGGTYGKDGLWYMTGHDLPEVYVMKLPSHGFTLEHVKTIPISAHGQGIAMDRSASGLVLYGIKRAENTVVVDEIK